MLSETSNVLVYDKPDQAQARSILMVVAESLADSMRLSDPSLTNLVIVDGDNDPEWKDFLPTVPIISLSDVTSGREPISPSACVICLSPEFLRRRSTRRIAARAPRFYGMSSNRKFTLPKPVLLKGVAA